MLAAVASWADFAKLVTVLSTFGPAGRLSGMSSCGDEALCKESWYSFSSVALLVASITLSCFEKLFGLTTFFDCVAIPSTSAS